MKAHTQRLPNKLDGGYDLAKLPPDETVTAAQLTMKPG